MHRRTPGSVPASMDVPTRSVRHPVDLPPTACGIATFSAALSAGLVANGATVDVVRIGASPEMEDPLVVASLGDGTRDRLATAAVLNDSDIAIVQHEYGIYGGPDGADVVAVLDAVTVPTIVVAHTVVRNPTPNQRLVLERVCDAADAVVVMTDSACIRPRPRLRRRCVEDRHHPAWGGDPIDGAAVRHPQGSHRAPRLLTWGLLGPGKGIEWAIDAVATLADLRPRPNYLVAGATHPKVLARSGEAYRQMLLTRSWSSGASPFVSFDDTYRDLAALTELIAVRRPRHSPVRLRRPGHVGRPGRCHRRWATRGLDRLPTRR